jgi:hypothetical protein
VYTNPLTTMSSSSSDKTFNTEDTIQGIQGPCGNSTFESLSTSNEYGTKVIPRINDEQLIIEERYSTIDGCFGTVSSTFFFFP